MKQTIVEGDWSFHVKCCINTIQNDIFIDIVKLLLMHQRPVKKRMKAVFQLG